MSIRGTSRITGTAIGNSVAKLLVDAGHICYDYQYEHLRNLPCTRFEVDEVWSFVYAKEKNVAGAKAAPEHAGDVWTWTAICADTKLIPAWQIGDRSSDTAIPFMLDLASRMSHRIQLTSDGHKAYRSAVERAFGREVDYAMLVKMYGNQGADGGAHRRYSPGTFNGSERIVVSGAPKLDKISTSYAERSNLTLRMSMRRFTRLTNAFSKKLANHHAMVALFMMYYNYSRKHATLKTTPAVAAGATDRMWTVEDIVKLIDERTPQSGPRGPYKKRTVVLETTIDSVIVQDLDAGLVAGDHMTHSQLSPS